MALDRDVAQALDRDAYHRQDHGDPLGSEERAMLAVGSVIRSPGALDGTPNERSASELGEALQQRGDDRGCGENRAEVRRLEVELAKRVSPPKMATRRGPNRGTRASDMRFRHGSTDHL